MRLSSPGSMDLHIKSKHANRRTLKLEALVLPKITSDPPSYRVAFNGKWQHLTDLELADPDFGMPGGVDMFLGADIYLVQFYLADDLVNQERRPHSRPLSNGS